MPGLSKKDIGTIIKTKAPEIHSQDNNKNKLKPKDKADALEYSFIQMLKQIPQVSTGFLIEGYNCLFSTQEGRLLMQWDLWDSEWMRFSDWDPSTQMQIFNEIKKYVRSNKC